MRWAELRTISGSTVGIGNDQRPVSRLLPGLLAMTLALRSAGTGSAATRAVCAFFDSLMRLIASSADAAVPPENVPFAVT